jgi:hypothetical protein
MLDGARYAVRLVVDASLEVFSLEAGERDGGPEAPLFFTFPSEKTRHGHRHRGAGVMRCVRSLAGRYRKPAGRWRATLGVRASSIPYFSELSISPKR